MTAGRNMPNTATAIPSKTTLEVEMYVRSRTTWRDGGSEVEGDPALMEVAAGVLADPTQVRPAGGWHTRDRCRRSVAGQAAPGALPRGGSGLTTARGPTAARKTQIRTRQNRAGSRSCLDTSLSPRKRRAGQLNQG